MRVRAGQHPGDPDRGQGVRNLRRDPWSWLCVLPDGFFGRWVQVDSAPTSFPWRRQWTAWRPTTGESLASTSDRSEWRVRPGVVQGSREAGAERWHQLVERDPDNAVIPRR